MRTTTFLAFAACALLTIGTGACITPEHYDEIHRGGRDEARISKNEAIASNIKHHIEFLADDLLEGRLPGTRGGALSARYLATQAQLIGLKPGAGDGSYFQPVPLVGIETNAGSTVQFDAPDRPGVALQYLEEFVGADETLNDKTRFEGQVVFVGYGIVAPEQKWNDYADVDVRGKVVLILANEPGRNDPNKNDLFGGKALTYYGRWTYKFEEAARRGAAGAFLIHTDESAGYNWQVVRNSWGRERPYAQPGSGAALQAASWITERVATETLARAGLDINDLRARAEVRGFKPVATNLSATINWTARMRPIPTANVIAMLPGSDPKLASEYIVYSAHYDHLGFAPPENGDAICNGAVDNATGCGAVLEIARLFATSAPPKRSILFAWVTAEEGGLRGSEFFANHPTVPIGKIIANINLDGLPPSGDPMEVSPLGYKRSTLRALVEKTADEMNLSVIDDRNPAQGSFFRSDHFSFAKVGVPAINVNAGYQYRNKPEGWGREREELYRKNSYHRPSDNYDPSWDCVAPARLAEYSYRLGRTLAFSAEYPEYLKGDEFARKR
ncbi:MAG: M28 family peptidase [Planctomycetota bacterium]